jgi:hypothetical protein
MFFHVAIVGDLLSRTSSICVLPWLQKLPAYDFTKVSNEQQAGGHNRHLHLHPSTIASQWIF